MSKLYPAYLSIKKLDSSTILLFKSGIFYILLENDARIVSSILNLKLSNLNQEVVKCSFHINSLEKYLPILVKNKLDIKIIDLENISINNNYYNNRMLDLNNQYFNNYPNMAINNVQDVFRNGFNLNNIFEFLNSIDFRNLNAIIGLMSDGLDINNINFGNFNNNEETYKNYTNQSTYNNEMVINFFNSLKPILRSEFIDIIDNFIQFYMDEINKEK